jgi:hypothetical protein
MPSSNDSLTPIAPSLSPTNLPSSSVVASRGIRRQAPDRDRGCESTQPGDSVRVCRLRSRGLGVDRGCGNENRHQASAKQGADLWRRNPANSLPSFALSPAMCGPKLGFSYSPNSPYILHLRAAVRLTWAFIFSDVGYPALVTTFSAGDRENVQHPGSAQSVPKVSRRMVARAS